MIFIVTSLHKLLFQLFCIELISDCVSEALRIGVLSQLTLGGDRALSTICITRHFILGYLP